MLPQPYTHFLRLATMGQCCPQGAPLRELAMQGAESLCVRKQLLKESSPAPTVLLQRYKKITIVP